MPLYTCEHGKRNTPSSHVQNENTHSNPVTTGTRAPEKHIYMRPNCQKPIHAKVRRHTPPTANQASIHRHTDTHTHTHTSTHPAIHPRRHSPSHEQTRRGNTQLQRADTQVNSAIDPAIHPHSEQVTRSHTRRRNTYTHSPIVQNPNTPMLAATYLQKHTQAQAQHRRIQTEM